MKWGRAEQGIVEFAQTWLVLARAKEREVSLPRSYANMHREITQAK